MSEINYSPVFGNFPIISDVAKKFWGSKHIANKVKSIIAFSTDVSNANDNLRRYGYSYHFRKRVLKSYGKYVNNPTMKGIPYSELKDSIWKDI